MPLGSVSATGVTPSVSSKCFAAASIVATGAMYTAVRFAGGAARSYRIVSTVIFLLSDEPGGGVTPMVDGSRILLIQSAVDSSARRTGGISVTRRSAATAERLVMVGRSSTRQPDRVKQRAGRHQVGRLEPFRERRVRLAEVAAGGGLAAPAAMQANEGERRSELEGTRALPAGDVERVPKALLRFAFQAARPARARGHLSNELAPQPVQIGLVGPLAGAQRDRQPFLDGAEAILGTLRPAICTGQER